jgi:hypothetical protein
MDPQSDNLSESMIQGDKEVMVGRWRGMPQRKLDVRLGGALDQGYFKAFSVTSVIQ